MRICRNSDAAQSTSYLTITLSLSLFLSPRQKTGLHCFSPLATYLLIYISFTIHFLAALTQSSSSWSSYAMFMCSSLHSFRKSFLTPSPPPGNRGFHTSCKYDCTVSMVFLKGWMDKTFSSAHQTLLLKALKTWDWLRYMISTSVCIKVASGCMHGGCWSSIWLQIKLSTFTLLN